MGTGFKLETCKTWEGFLGLAKGFCVSQPSSGSLAEVQSRSRSLPGGVLLGSPSPINPSGAGRARPRFVGVAESQIALFPPKVYLVLPRRGSSSGAAGDNPGTAGIAGAWRHRGGRERNGGGSGVARGASATPGWIWVTPARSVLVATSGLLQEGLGIQH